VTNPSPAVRLAIYRLVGALLAVLAAYNVISPDAVPVLLELVGALGGVGAAVLASVNVRR
jgi:hypothetical protein